MKSDAVRIAELNAQRDRERDLIKVLTHPLLMATGIYVLVEFLQKKKLMGDISGSALEGAAIAIPVLVSAFETGAAEKYLQTISELAKTAGDTTGNLLKSAGTLMLTKGVVK